MGNCQSGGSCGNASCEKLTFFASVLVLALFVVDAGLILMNRGLQNDISTRQTELAEKSTRISQSAAFDNISRGIIQALANAAINKKDEQIKALLIQNNVQLKPAAESAAPAPAAAPKK